ncbi:hypothetical protein AAMO2058_000301200 [Amorphochlora amoebiformis]
MASQNVSLGCPEFGFSAYPGKVEIIPGFLPPLGLGSWKNILNKYQESMTTTVPGGSWKNSAKEVKWDGKELSALLRDCRGAWQKAAIRPGFNECFENNDGKFKKVALPGGSWIKTAKDVHYDQGTLHANLRKINGQYQKSTIKADVSDVLENINGSFRAQVPGGSWKQSAADITYSGGILKARLRTRNGQWKSAEIKASPNSTLANIDGEFKIQ